MSSSFLSRRIRRTSDLLRVGASDQVSEYEERFRSLQGGGPQEKDRLLLYRAPDLKRDLMLSSLRISTSCWKTRPGEARSEEGILLILSCMREHPQSGYHPQIPFFSV